MEYISCFIKGLNDNYQNIRTQILHLDPIPNLNHVYSMVSQQELVPPSPCAVTPIILYANNSTPTGCGRERGFMKGSMIWTNYHKTNHTVDNCYFKHDFPPGYHMNNTNPTYNSKPNALVIKMVLSQRKIINISSSFYNNQRKGLNIPTLIKVSPHTQS